MNLSRKSLIGTFALVASLSAPLAFAQTDTTATDASMQSTTPTDTSAQTAPTPAEPTTYNDAAAATTQGDPVKKSWADVDLDKDGSLSKAEASAVPSLGQVFDKADGNADGALSADEYKAYVSKSGDGKKK
jgi:hypothetical protein